MEKNTESETLQKLLASFQPYPNMRFMLFARKWSHMEQTISDFCENNGHGLFLYRFPGLDEEDVPKKDFLGHKPYRIDQRRYDMQGKFYEYIFVNGKLPDPKLFLRKIYPAIANAGRLYIMTETTSSTELDLWEQLLCEANYVSTSMIELSETTHFVSAKKMHGWGR
jgi:hypothetical protein